MNKVIMVSMYAGEFSLLYKFEVRDDKLDNLWEEVEKEISSKIIRENPALGFGILSDFCRSFIWKDYSKASLGK